MKKASFSLEATSKTLQILLSETWKLLAATVSAGRSGQVFLDQASKMLRFLPHTWKGKESSCHAKESCKVWYHVQLVKPHQMER